MLPVRDWARPRESFTEEQVGPSLYIAVPLTAWRCANAFCSTDHACLLMAWLCSAWHWINSGPASPQNVESA